MLRLRVTTRTEGGTETKVYNLNAGYTHRMAQLLIDYAVARSQALHFALADGSKFELSAEALQYVDTIAFMDPATVPPDDDMAGA